MVPKPPHHRVRVWFIGIMLITSGDLSPGAPGVCRSNLYTFGDPIGICNPFQSFHRVCELLLLLGADVGAIITAPYAQQVLRRIPWQPGRIPWSPRRYLQNPCDIHRLLVGVSSPSGCGPPDGVVLRLLLRRVRCKGSAQSLWWLLGWETGWDGHGGKETQRCSVDE